MDRRQFLALLSALPFCRDRLADQSQCDRSGGPPDWSSTRKWNLSKEPAEPVGPLTLTVNGKAATFDPDAPLEEIARVCREAWNVTRVGVRRSQDGTLCFEHIGPPRPPQFEVLTADS